MATESIKLFDSLAAMEEFVPIQSIRSLMVDGKDICLARNKDGIYAFENKCPHYSVPLDTGNLNYIGEVVCSLHAYRFNLANGWETTGKKVCLKKYKLDIVEGSVFIKF